MNPYQAPKSVRQSTVAEQSSIYAGVLFRANWIAGGCILVFALNFFLKRNLLSADQTQFVPIVVWCVVAFLVFRFPRQLGIIIGLLMLSAIFMQRHFYEKMILNLQSYDYLDSVMTPAIVATFWRNFWISVLPLFIGAPFAIASTWLSQRKTDTKDQSQR